MQKEVRSSHVKNKGYMIPKEKKILKQNTYKTSHSHAKKVRSSLVKWMA